MTQHDDYHREPVPGLPARLPEGEQVLWQGKPERGAIARNALHNRKVGFYFLALALWKLLSGIADGKTVSEHAFSIGGTLVLGSLALVLIALISRLIERTTVYTITNRRIVMRFGIAIPITFQFPFTQITSADVKFLNDKVGTIVFSLKEHTKISWLVLWPHVRGWKVAKPQPALRAIADVDAVKDILVQHLKAAHDLQTDHQADGTPELSSANTRTSNTSPTPKGGMNLGHANTGTA